MKKIISLCLSLAMMLTVFTATSLTAQAEEYEKTIDGITYSIDAETSEAWVFGADKSITTANILSEVDGCAVTIIGGGAFFECDALESVTIPNSVTQISSCAFYGCTSLLDKLVLQPLTRPASIGPPLTKTVGTLILAAAINKPGTFLSQFGIITNASN